MMEAMGEFLKFGPFIWGIWLLKVLMYSTFRDVACNSYEKYTEDVKLLKAMGVNSLSISFNKFAL